MQAVNTSAAGIAKRLTDRDRHGNNANSLSRLQRRNSLKFEKILFNLQFCCGINIFSDV